jgi:hypothetical protein
MSLRSPFLEVDEHPHFYAQIGWTPYGNQECWITVPADGQAHTLTVTGAAVERSERIVAAPDEYGTPVVHWRAQPPLPAGMYQVLLDDEVRFSIRVAPDVYRDAQDSILSQMYLRRCGIWCHRHDADLRDVSDPADFGRVLGHIDASGGWHDAHDDNKWVIFVFPPVWGLMEVYEAGHYEYRAGNTVLPPLLDEIWWEIAWLLKMQKADGSFYHGVFEWWVVDGPDGQPCMAVHPPEPFYNVVTEDRRAVIDMWGENAVCRVMGRRPGTSPSIPDKYFAANAALFARCAVLMQPHDPELARRLAEAATCTLDWLQAHASCVAHTTERWAFEGLAWLYLHRLDAERYSWQRVAERFAAMQGMVRHSGALSAGPGLAVVELQVQEQMPGEIYPDIPFAYMQFPLKLLVLDTPLAESAREMLQGFAQFLQHNLVAGYGNLGKIREGEETLHPMMTLAECFNGYSRWWSSAATLLLHLGRQLGDAAMIRDGERQVQWLLGANPTGVCCVNNLGIYHTAMYPAEICSTTHERGSCYRYIRDFHFMAPTGLHGDDQRRPQVFINGPFRYHSVGRESWLADTGWMLAALAALVD